MTEIEFVEHAKQATAVVRENVITGALPDFFARAFNAVGAELQRQEIPPSGMPFAYYHGAVGGEVVDVEAGFPVPRPLRAESAVLPSELPACRAAEALHVGPYDTLERTYRDMDAAIRAGGDRPTEDMWEVYLSGPDVDSDPATWRTLVTLPLNTDGCARATPAALGIEPS